MCLSPPPASAAVKVISARLPREAAAAAAAAIVCVTLRKGERGRGKCFESRPSAHFFVCLRVRSQLMCVVFVSPSLSPTIFFLLSFSV